MDKNQGYAILKAVMLENGRGFALGEHPTAPSRYVTWACYDDKDGQRQYEWGHYGNDRTAMEQDFTDRVQDYQRIYNVGIRQTEAPGLYKYYSTQRPVDIGTFPKPPYNKPDEIFNYDQRIPVENGSFLAWGYLTYTRPLTEKQASDYELRPAPDNPDRPRPIAEQMKNAAKLAEADRGSEAPAPQRRQRNKKCHGDGTQANCPCSYPGSGCIDLRGKLQTCNVQSALYLIALEPVQPQIRGDPTGDFCHIDIKQLFVFGALLFAGEHHHL